MIQQSTSFYVLWRGKRDALSRSLSTFFYSGRGQVPSNSDAYIPDWYAPLPRHSTNSFRRSSRSKLTFVNRNSFFFQEGVCPCPGPPTASAGFLTGKLLHPPGLNLMFPQPPSPFLFFNPTSSDSFPPQPQFSLFCFNLFWRSSVLPFYFSDRAIWPFRPLWEIFFPKLFSPHDQSSGTPTIPPDALFYVSTKSMVT